MVNGSKKLVAVITLTGWTLAVARWNFYIYLDFGDSARSVSYER
jgi:hypothetical protein